MGRANSNKSDLFPGLGKRPFLSIYNERVTFTRETCVEYENYREAKLKGKDSDVAGGAVRARRLFSELAAMAAERAISKLAQGDDEKSAETLEQFRLLLAALDRKGILYGIITSSKVEKLKIADEPFFDSARMEILADCAGGLGDGSSQRGRNRAACNGRLEVEISAVNGEDSTPLLVPLTTAQLKAFGLLGQDGKPDCGKQITLSCSVPQQPQDEEESDDGHGGEVSANFEGSPTSLKRQKTGRADTMSKHPTKRLRGHSTTSTNAPEEANRDGTHQSNYETGGPDFDDIPPHAQLRLNQSPVADQVHFDQDSDSVTSISEIRPTLARCKEHFRAHKDGIHTAKEAEVAGFFKNNLSSAAFVNKDLAAAAARKLGSMSTAYVFVDGVLKVVKGKVMERHLAAPHTAKYIFSQGEAYGSLRDLVVGKYGTRFPMPVDRGAWKGFQGEG